MKAVLLFSVVPGAPRSEVKGLRGDAIRIAIHAQPEKGKANRALIAFLAGRLGLAKSDVHILRGRTGRLKQVAFDGKSEEEIRTILFEGTDL